MAFDPAIAIAAISFIVEVMYNEANLRGQEGRSAQSTEAAGLYQLLRDRFNITKDQLSQFAEKLDIKLNQLTDSTRGSARLSTASKNLRSYLAEYPQLKERVNKMVNKLSEGLKAIGELESNTQADITRRQGFSKSKFVKDVSPIVNEINTSLTDFNNNKSSNNNNVEGIQDPSLIDTNLEQDYDKHHFNNKNPDDYVYGHYESDFSPGNETI